MSTPSIQTLITQAQQVLNLKSSNEIRATLAAILANANVGTPLNPNLTTQQLWDEFYEIVRQPSDDIMSIITDQMMRMVFSPPAPGGAGADKQVIFNDGGVLAGDAGLMYNKATDALTITGDLTVDTNVLKVDTTNNRVGILTASPRSPFALDVLGNVALGDSTTTTGLRLKLDCVGTAGNVAIMSFATAGTNKAFYGLSGGYMGDASTDAIVATDAAGAGIRFFVADTGVEVARFNSTGNLAFANGKGIDFSAVTGGTGTATANVLNDYEEGTWTGTITGSTTNPTVPFTQVGRYTKIGRQVNVQIWFFNVDTTGASGDVLINGLPFANAAGNSAVPGSVSSQTLANFTGTLISQIGTSGTGFELYSVNSGAGMTNATHNPGAARRLALSSTYQTA